MKKAAPKKRGPGRPPKHAPTPEKIRQAQEMAAHGMRREDIAKAMGMSRRTFFEQGYPEHLEGADKIALARVSATLYSIATDRTHPKCVTAGIWIEKTRGGYRETTDVNVSVDVEKLFREEVSRWAMPAGEVSAN